MTNITLRQLEGFPYNVCIDPDLLAYWNRMLNRRLAWIRKNRDKPGIDTTDLITGYDGLPTCANLSTEPIDFDPIAYADKYTNALELKLLFQPVNRAWAQGHIAAHQAVERVIRILEDRPKTTHFAWGHVLDWITNMDVTRFIKTLDLMERIMDAKRIYFADFEQLRHFANKPYSSGLHIGSPCMQNMCRIIGLDVDDKFTWLYLPLYRRQLACRAEHIQNFILPVHQALSGNLNRTIDVAGYVGGRLRLLLDADHNKELLRQLDGELVDMMHQIRATAPQV
ncbi:uncharacterized protein BKA55DRAFT_531798 [Fusarium redolens]|uniref:Uncharacterized protein n=1 Tax=Fusarium redolens TaxID=48865 RepID=A0A9P9KV68_FUSRE|nr:uncharacterized protein BKA55DRAFT_531798 [Fusarium redolens]KAH7269131.1 hypothetical protein BKA55DRAFT_531798 [Fusarium redolens]